MKIKFKSTFLSTFYKSKSLFITCFLLLASANYYALNQDSIINSYWRSGKLKTSTIYKIKHSRYDKNTILTILKKKKTLYYNLAGIKMTKSSFNFEYNSNNFKDKQDSLLIENIERSIKEQSCQKNVSFNIVANYHKSTLKLSSHLDTVFLHLINCNDTVYKEKDTLIRALHFGDLRYSVNLFRVDSFLKDSIKHIFIGALRLYDSKMYYYDNTTMSEKKVFDLSSYFPKYTENGIANFNYEDKYDNNYHYNINNNGINNLVEKSTAFTLANIILFILEGINPKVNWRR